MTRPLTEKQARVLAFIVEYRREHGYSPTFDEIGAHMGISKNAVTDYIKALVKKDAVVKHHGMHRGVIPVAEVGA